MGKLIKFKRQGGDQERGCRIGAAEKTSTSAPKAQENNPKKDCKPSLWGKMLDPNKTVETSTDRKPVLPKIVVSQK